MASTSGNVGTSELPAAPPAATTKQRTASRELTSSPEEAVGQAVPMTPPVDQGRLPTSSSSVASSWQPIETPTPTAPTTPAADEKSDWYSRWNNSNTPTAQPPAQSVPAQQTGGSSSSGSVSGRQSASETEPVPVDQGSVGEPTIRDVLKQALMRRLTGRGGRGRSGRRST